jgi:hypothetical protein
MAMNGDDHIFKIDDPGCCPLFLLHGVGKLALWGWQVYTAVHLGLWG